MAKSPTPTLRQRLANADRRRLKERADGRENMRRLLQTTVTPQLERIKWALAQEPPRLDIVRDRVDALLSTIADRHAQLDTLDSVDRERASTLPEGPELDH